MISSLDRESAREIRANVDDLVNRYSLIETLVVLGQRALEDSLSTTESVAIVGSEAADLISGVVKKLRGVAHGRSPVRQGHYRP